MSIGLVKDVEIIESWSGSGESEFLLPNAAVGDDALGTRPWAWCFRQCSEENIGA